MSLPGDVRFEHPVWLWLLCALPFFAAWRVFYFRRTAIVVAGLQHAAPAPWRRALVHVGWIFETLVLALFLVALAGPGLRRTQVLLHEPGLDVAFVLDVSATMQAKDFQPNRLEALKELTRAYLKRSSGDRIALYAFAGFVFTQSPLSADAASALDLLDGIAYEMISHSESGGTAIGDALVAAAGGLAKTRLPGRGQVLILITDGENNAGVDPELAGRFVKSLGIHAYLIGMAGEGEIPVFEPNGKPFIGSSGKPLTTRLDDRELRRIATAAGATYARASTGDMLGALLRDIENVERTALERGTAATLISWRPRVAGAAFALLCLWLALEGLFLRRPLR